MLKKLAGFAFCQVLIITFLLRQIPQVDAGLQSIEALLPFASGYNVGGIAIALGIALVSHILPLHDRVSDLRTSRARTSVFDASNSAIA